MNKIFIIPFSEDLIKRTAEIIYNNHKNFENIAVVFPGKRPGLFLLKYLSSFSRKVIIPPQRFSITEFMKWLSAKGGLHLREPKKMELQVILYKVVKKIEEEKKKRFGKITETFDRFMPWAGYIIKMIEELNRENIEEFSHFLSYTKEEIPVQVRKLWESIDEIKERFIQTLLAKKIAGAGIEYITALQNIKNGVEVKEFDSIYFIGFYSLTKVETEIIKFFLENQNAYMIIQTDPEMIKKEAIPPSPYYHHQRMIKELNAEPTLLFEPSLIYPKIHYYEGYNLHSEINQIREIIQNMKSRGSELCITLCDESALFPIIHEVVAPLKEKFNITMGYPIKNSTLFSLMNAICEAQTLREENQYHFLPYLSVLKHPYIKNLKIEKNEIKKAIYRIERHVVKNNMVYVPLDRIEKDLSKHFPFLKILHEKLFFNFEKVDSISSLADRFIELLSWIASNSEIVSNLVTENLFYHMFSILHDIKEITELEEITSDKLSTPQSLYSIFIYLLEQEKVPFEGEPLKGIQIMGMLETRTLKFSKVILLDVNEGIVPAINKDDPLLPYSVRKMLGLPTIEDTESVYAYNFHRLVRTADEVWIFYTKGESSLHKSTRSRFIEQLLWEEEKQKKKILEDEKINKINIIFHPSMIDTNPIIEKTPEIIEKLLNTEYSATMFTSYLRCPVGFYFEHILGLRRREEVEESLRGPGFGNLFHEFLKKLYKKEKLSYLLRDLSKILKQGYKLIDEKLSTHRGTKGFSLYARSTLRAFLVYFLKNELERMKTEKEIEIVALEEKLKREIPYRDRKIILQGVVDRIDHITHPDGRDEYLIIDYKTGASDIKFIKGIEKVFKKDSEFSQAWKYTFQLYYYLYLLDKIPSFKKDAAIYDLKKRNLNRLFSPQKGKISEREKEMKKFEDIIYRWFEELFDINIPFERKRKTTQCDKCIYRTLCQKPKLLKS